MVAVNSPLAAIPPRIFLFAKLSIANVIGKASGIMLVATAFGMASIAPPYQLYCY